MNEQTEPEIKVRFVVTDDLVSPETISELLGIAPSQVWMKGERTHPKASNCYEHNGWVLAQTASGHAASVEHLAEKIFSAIDLQAIQKLKRKHPSVSTGLSVIVYVTTSAPVVSLSPSQVKYLADVGADIDIDIYPQAE